MAITTKASGTQTAVITTEHTLDTEADVGIYVFMVNLVNLANGDVVILRAKTKVLTGDTAASIYTAVYSHSQGGTPIVASPPITSMHQLIITLEQSAGTGRNFPWSLLQIDA